MSTMVSVSALRDEMRDRRRPQMIDVRTASEYASGHIPCAVNIPMDQFESRRRDLRLEDGVVLICKAGGRAQIVAGWLGERQSRCGCWRAEPRPGSVRAGAGELGQDALVAGAAGAVWARAC